MDRDCDVDLITQSARDALLDLVASISQEGYCATWMDDASFRLWKIEGGARYGNVIVSHELAALLAALSAFAGGWVIWDNGGKFIPMADWLNVLSQRKG